MRIEYTLFEVPLATDGDSPLAHPPMRCSFDAPADGIVERVWVRHRSSGGASLCVLWSVWPRLEPAASLLVAADLPVTADSDKVVELVA